MILRLALRSLLRRRQRTLVTAAALGLAGAVMLFFSCLVEGFQHAMVSNIIDLECGHLQAHVKGYRLDPDLYSTLEPLELPGAAQSPRLYAWGLAALGDNSAAVELRGLDPALESQVTRIHSRVSEGSWLDAAQPEGAVLGRELARKLRAKVGDSLVVLTQAADGSLADRLYRVKGVLGQVGVKADEFGFFVVTGAFRELLQAPQGWHELAYRLPGPRPDARAQADAHQARNPGAEVLDWRRLKPMSAQILETQRIGVLILMAIAYAAVGLVVFNAMLMNVFDRLREFGVMKALGATPLFLARLVYAEALLEAGLAAALALAVGLPLTAHFETAGIDFSGLLSSSANVAGMLFEPVLHPRLTWGALLPPLAFLFALAALTVLYPAGKAAALDPVAAMRHR